VRSSTQSVSPLQFVLEPRRLIRWIYVGRLTIATALIVTALVSWQVVDSDKTLAATLCFVGAIFVTAAAFTWTEVNRRPQTEAFLYSQLVTDLLVVTAVVHVTGGGASQFAALYIVVNTAAALLLPPGRTILVSLLGIVLYVLDALTLLNEGPDLTLVLRLVVFSVVAVGTGYISARLKQAGQGRERLAAELATVRLREKDILANIPSCIIIVDAEGDLLFANGTASALLGIELESFYNKPVVEALRAAAPVLAEVLERSLRDGSRILRAEGTTAVVGRQVPFGVTITSASGEGQPAGRTITAIFQDISDQKRLELLNLRAQRLEAVAEFDASLAQEIKNPLASIRSAVEQLSARPNATTDERTLGTLIVRESDRLSRLLSEFLDFSRVRATRRDRVMIGPVVQGAAALASEHPERVADTRIAVEIGAGFGLAKCGEVQWGGGLVPGPGGEGGNAVLVEAQGECKDATGEQCRPDGRERVGGERLARCRRESTIHRSCQRTVHRYSRGWPPPRAPALARMKEPRCSVATRRLCRRERPRAPNATAST